MKYVIKIFAIILILSNNSCHAQSSTVAAFYTNGIVADIKVRE